MLKVIYVLPQTEAFELQLATDHEGHVHLSDLQALVGGTIAGINFEDGIDGYVNDEGLLIGLPPNVMANDGSDKILAGPLVFTRTDEEGHTISVEPGDLAAVNAWLTECCTRPMRVDYGY